MVLSISGMSSQLALKLIDSTRDSQLQQLRSEPANQRGADAFRERIGSITTPEELVKDFEVYSFVMRAFDLEDQIFGKGMIRKILESDPSDDTALVNRLSDPRFGELHAALGFTTATGPQTPNFNDPAWQDGIVNQYYETVFVNSEAEQNSTVGTVLEFREKAASLNNWFDVLKNKELTNFFRVALALPREMAGLNVDKQAAILGKKYDLTKLTDPVEQEKLISRFTAISDVLTPPQGVYNSSALTVLRSIGRVGSAVQIISLQLNVAPVQYSASSLYR
jgi:Protein of unknown function (DUF1217)